ncbi:glycoside hydrolase family protein, partial [Escherichia coli]|uniref:lysozyme n=1 Tax=Escherichia coli TaxID=562 RepID=UPI003995AC25
TDGREIQREWLEQMAASYNPTVYTALINLEHIKSYLPDSTFIWTDGIGNTSGVIPGKTITERQAAEGLISNVLRVELALERCVKQQPPQKVYDAVVSFAFNVGTGNACSSTLVKLLNQRRWADACRQLPRWVYVKGVFNQGLDNRRAREMAWCLKGAGL